MLSLAISSLGKQEGGWYRKIIWTFSLAMDPTPPRGGQGCRPGWQLGSILGSPRRIIQSEERQSESQRGLKAGRPLGSANFRWSVQNVETMPSVSADAMGVGGWGLLTVPTWARRSHRYVQANDRQDAGIERCYRLVRKCLPPLCPLLPTSSFLATQRAWRHTQTDTWNIELLTQCLCVNAWVIARVCVIIWMRELLIRCPINVHYYYVHIFVTCFCDGVIGIAHLEPNSPLIFRKITPLHASGKASALEQHDW